MPLATLMPPLTVTSPYAKGRVGFFENLNIARLARKSLYVA